MKTYFQLKNLYLILAFIGLITTWYFNIQFYLTAEDTSISNFISQTMLSFPAKSISADLSVVVIVFFFWKIRESRELKIKYWWVVIPLTFLVAIAFSFPLFLWMREKRLETI